jgi:hypothetical protein
MPFEISYAEECAVEILHEIQFKNTLSFKKKLSIFSEDFIYFLFFVAKNFRNDQNFCSLNKRDHVTTKMDEFFLMKF